MATKYVTPSGAGAKNGDTWATAYDLAAFKTYIEASAAPADIYYIYSGSYTLTAIINVTARDGNTVDPIKMIGISDQTLMTEAQGSNRPSFTIAGNYWSFGAYYKIANCQFTGTGTNSILAEAYGIFRNCSFNNTGGGRAFTANGSNILLVNCEAQSAAGIAFYNNSTIGLRTYGCYIHDSITGYQQLGQGYGGLWFTIIDTCTTGIDIDKFDMDISNCTVYNCTTGIDGAATVYGCRINNNLIIDCTTGASWATDNKSNYFDYNFYYGCGTTTSNVTEGPNSDETQVKSPGFANASGGNFTISVPLKHNGFPGAFPGGLTTGYLAPGAVQPKSRKTIL